jgi:hypothetical protein
MPPVVGVETQIAGKPLFAGVSDLEEWLKRRKSILQNGTELVTLAAFEEAQELVRRRCRRRCL